MGSKLTHTVSGAMASFKSADKTNIESLKVYFNPIQEGTGDPSPSNVREISGWNNIQVIQSGKNLYNPEELIRCDGYYLNDNGVETVSGNGTSGYMKNLIKISPNTHYNINGYFTTQSSNAIRIYQFDKDKKWISRQTWGLGSTGNRSYIRYISPSNCYYIALQYILEQTDLSSIEITPTQEYEPSYEPYNGQTIPITFPAIGKNLLNTLVEDGTHPLTINCKTYNMGYHQKNLYWLQANNVSNLVITQGNISYTQAGLGAGFGVSYCLHLIPGQTYMMSGTTVNGRVRYDHFDKDGTLIGYLSPNYNNLNRTFTIPNNTYYTYITFAPVSNTANQNISFSNLQLELGSTATAYEAPNNTFYGGYIDLINGTLVQTHAKFIDDGSEGTSVWEQIIRTDFIGYNRTDLSTLGILQPYIGYKTGIFNYCKSPLTGGTWEGAIGSNGNNPNNDLRLLVPTSFTTIESFLTYLSEHPLEIIYELATPITYQLTPIQLKTFLNQNNIWSNTNGDIECTYEVIDHLNKKRITLNEPHIEAASGAIATFNTDVAAPLKECKIYFNPIQEGSGDPSPENIRNINGRNSIIYHHTQKNFFDINILTGTNITIENGIVTATGGYFHQNFGNPNGVGVPLNLNFGSSRWILSMETYTNGEQASEHSVGLYIYFDYTDGTKSGHGCYNDETTFTNHIFTSSTNKQVSRIRFSYSQKGNNIWHIRNIHLEPMDSFISYEPYNGIQSVINWEDDYGTIYGGYVDLINGKLYSTYRKLNLANVTWYNFSGHTIHFASILERPANGLIFSNMLTPKINTIAPGQTGIGYYNDRDNERKRIYVQKNEAVTNDTEFRTWFAETYPDAYIIYELETPIEYPLTSQQLKTLQGINNIWSNTNGNVEVKYWTH